MYDMTWDEIRRDRRYRNCWVALDHCEYGENGIEPHRADVVDSDNDLSELCTRLAESDRSRCAIVFCTDSSAGDSPPVQLPERRRFLRAS
jgi:hypothetical protein